MLFTRHLMWPQTILSAVVGIVSLFSLPTSAQEPGGSAASGHPLGWASHAHDSQHTAISSVAAQSLNTIHWTTPVDLHPVKSSGEILIHYGSPLVTPANTVVVPVKTGKNGFRAEAHDGSDGSLLWTQDSAYQAPSAIFTPSFSPVLHGNKLFIPDAGGTVLVRESPDQAGGKVTRLVFYGAQNFDQDPRAYSENVQINTPITADANGNIYFGFLVIGPTPIELQSGLAKITPAGTGSWIAATFATGDSNAKIKNCPGAHSKAGPVCHLNFRRIRLFAGPQKLDA